MKVIINGSVEEVTENIFLSQLLQHRLGEIESYACAVNGNFIARDNHETFQLNSNDIVDIVSPMQGG